MRIALGVAQLAAKDGVVISEQALKRAVKRLAGRGLLVTRHFDVADKVGVLKDIRVEGQDLVGDLLVTDPQLQAALAMPPQLSVAGHVLPAGGISISAISLQP